MAIKKSVKGAAEAAKKTTKKVVKKVEKALEPVGKAIANAPATTHSDIPWLKIEVISKRGSGVLSSVTTVQRINTVGGKAQATPGNPGAFQSVPYAADYVFLKKK